MAEVYAIKNGNWTDTTVWNTNALPLPDDDVFSNGFRVYTNTNFKVKSLTSAAGLSAIDGGRFDLTNGNSLTANIFAGGLNSSCMVFNSASPNSCVLYGNLYGTGLINSNTGTVTVFGNVSGGFVGQGYYGINNSSTGTIFVYGDVRGGRDGGSVNNAGILNTTGGTIFVVGNVVGGFPITNPVNNAPSPGIQQGTTSTAFITGNVIGTFQCNGIIHNGGTTCRSIIRGNVIGGGFINDSSSANAIFNQSTSLSSVIVYGNVVGGFMSSTHGINNTSTGTVTVFGNVSGGSNTTSYGIRNASTGAVYVYGEARGGIGATAHGVFNNLNNGIVYVRKAVGSGFGAGSSSNNVSFPSFGAANGLFNNAISGMCYVEEIECGLRGMFPIAGMIYLSGAANTKAVFQDGNGRQLTLFSSTPTIYLPLSSDVRAGLSFNNNSLTGSLGMPQPDQVNSGVPVDNTEGTALFDSNTVFESPISAIGEQGSIGARIKLIATNNSVQALINNLS